MTEDNGPLEMLVVTIVRPPVAKLIKSIFSIEISITIIYYFVFQEIGITIIRKLIFNKSNLIWYEELPRAEMVMVFIDAIELA